MCQFENESKETKVIFALMARKVEEFKEQDKEFVLYSNHEAL